MPKKTKEPQFGARVKVLREKSGLSLDALSKKAGISPRSLFGIEHGHVPSLRILKKVAEALGVMPANLL